MGHLIIGTFEMLDGGVVCFLTFIDLANTFGEIHDLKNLKVTMEPIIILKSQINNFSPNIQQITKSKKKKI